MNSERLKVPVFVIRCAVFATMLALALTVAADGWAQQCTPACGAAQTCDLGQTPPACIRTCPNACPSGQACDTSSANPSCVPIAKVLILATDVCATPCADGQACDTHHAGGPTCVPLPPAKSPSSCAATEYYDSTAKNCLPCPAGSVADETGAKCESIANAFSSGWLLRFGLSAGVAAVIHTPLSSHSLPSATDTYAAGVGASPMAYVAGMPAYWLGWSKHRRESCASAHFSKKVGPAGNAQHVLKHEMNKPKLPKQSEQEYYQEISAELSLEARRRDAYVQEKSAYDDLLNQHLQYNTRSEDLQEKHEPQGGRLPMVVPPPPPPLPTAPAPPSPEPDPTWGQCFAGDFGLWVGVPTTFQVNTVIDSAYAVTNPSSRSVRPIVSFGIALAPYPWLNLLGGVTFSNITGDISPTAPTTGSGKATPPDLQVWTLVWGIGGPFDLAGLLIGGK